MNDEVIAYRLKRETPREKEGTVFSCKLRFNAGTTPEQRESLIARSIFRADPNNNEKGLKRPKNNMSGEYVGVDILAEPDWFEEVFKITPEYATADELKKMKGKKA